MNDIDYMGKAVALAEKGRGKTSPNPLVGAIIVRDEEIIGKGYHRLFGGPHAEVLAIDDAGERAVGSKLFVTLEPCCIDAKTPACTDLITRAGIKEVVIGSIDPNPEISGRGAKALEAAGIKVSYDKFYEKKIANQNEIFFKYITTKKPFVLAKIALTIDGSISAKKGSLTRLSSAASSELVHQLRNEYDSIMIGVDTVLVDDPLLTTRIRGKEGKNPVRVIVDSKARTPINSNIVKTANEASTILATIDGADKKILDQFRDKGIDVITIEEDDERVEPEELLNNLGGREISSVLLEGGQSLFSTFLKKNLIDKFIFIITPIIIGSPEKVGLVDIGEEFSKRVRFEKIKKVGDDVVAVCYPN